MENQNQKQNKNVLAAVLLVLFFPVGLYLMWARTNWNKAVKWGITGFFVLMFIIGATSSNSSTNTTAKVASSTTTMTSTPAVSNTPAPTETPAPTIAKDANGFPEDSTAITVSQLSNTPTKYEGKKITFTCTVGAFAKDSNGNATAVNCSDPADSSEVIQVDTSAFDMSKIQKFDTIKIYGLGAGAATGTNALGGSITESLATGIYINDITSGYKE